MKKMVLLSVLLAFAAAASGCGSTGGDADVPQETTEAVTYFVDEDGNLYSEMPTVPTRDIQETADFEYTIEDGRALITKYTGNDADVVIPDTVDGVPVTEISYYAFEAKYDVRSVKVPETVTLIGECAFMDCSSLEEINIPEAVTGIDRGAFVACTSLKEVTIPKNVAYIREEAFTACEGMTSLRIQNPDLEYENWGLEELPGLTVYAPAGSKAAQWADAMGKYQPM